MIKKSKFFITALILLSIPSLSFASVFTMEEAVNRALEQNNQLKSVESAVKASESSFKSARSSFGPSISTSYAYVHNTKDQVTAIPVGVINDPTARPGDLMPMQSVIMNNGKNNYQWSLSISQPLFTGFALLNTYQKASLQKDSADLQYTQAKLSITGAVQENFLEYLKAEENIRSVNQALERVQAQLEVAKAFYDVGLRPNIDVMQAELDVSRNEIMLIQAQSTLETRRAQLNALLAVDNADSDTRFQGNLDPISFTLSLDECLNMAYQNRPDVALAKLSVQIAEKDSNLARSAFLPMVNAELSYSRFGDRPSVSGTRNMRDGYTTTQFMVAGQWNFFTSGKNYYQFDATQHNISRVKAEESDLMFTVAAEVKTRLLMARDAKQRIEVANKSVAQAQETHRMALSRYQLQVGTSIDVLTALTALASEEASLISAKADYLTALSKLYIAIGVMNPTLS